MSKILRFDWRECEQCFGCGQLCTRCTFPINACVEQDECDDIDTEEMIECSACGGKGKIPPNVDPGRNRELARA